MNTAAVLALMGDLYARVDALTRENDELRAALAQHTAQ